MEPLEERVDQMILDGRISLESREITLQLSKAFSQALEMAEAHGHAIYTVCVEVEGGRLRVTTSDPVR